VESLSPIDRQPDAIQHEVARFVLYNLYGKGNGLTRPGEAEEIQHHFATFGPDIALQLYGLPENDRRVAVAAVIDGMVSGMRPGGMRAMLHGLAAYNFVAPEANKAMDIVRDMAAADIAALPETVRPDRLTLATTDHIAWRVHGNQMRDSGGSYYKHPLTVGAISFAAFQRLRHEGYTISDDEIHARIATCLTHDAAEDTNRSRRYFDTPLTTETHVFSPLEVRYVCMATNNPHGDDVAFSLYMLTRHKLPGRLDYLPYVHRGLHDLGFRITKSADLQHNSVDPRPITSPAIARKVAEKNLLYDEAKWLVRTFDPNIPPQGVIVSKDADDSPIQNPAWEARYHQLVADTTADQLPHMVAALGEYIYGTNLPAHWQYAV